MANPTRLSRRSRSLSPPARRKDVDSSNALGHASIMYLNSRQIVTLRLNTRRSLQRYFRPLWRQRCRRTVYRRGSRPRRRHSMRHGPQRSPATCCGLRLPLPHRGHGKRASSSRRASFNSQAGSCGTKIFKKPSSQREVAKQARGSLKSQKCLEKAAPERQERCCSLSGGLRFVRRSL